MLAKALEGRQGNLAAAAALGRLARDELGITLSRLAVAWTLANAAGEVAVVGDRNPAHVDDAIAAADINLEPDAVERIDEIMRNIHPTAGASPEMMPEKRKARSR